MGSIGFRQGEVIEVGSGGSGKSECGSRKKRRWEEFECGSRKKIRWEVEKMRRWERFSTAIYSIGQTLTIVVLYEDKKVKKG